MTECEITGTAYEQVPKASPGLGVLTGQLLARPSYHHMAMHPLIDQKRIEIAHICKRLGIEKLEVFGSAARGTDFDPASSDADFLVEFAPAAKRGLDGYFALKAELEKLLGRNVDLVEPRSVRNPYVLAGIGC